MKMFLFIIILFSCTAFGQINFPFASSATKSDTVNIAPWQLAGFELPSTFSGDSLTFEKSTDGINFYPVYDMDGNRAAVKVRPSRFVYLEPWLGFVLSDYIILVSDSAQSAADTINAKKYGY